MLLELTSEKDLLKVVATGTFALSEAKRTFLEMLQAVAIHKSSKVLFDGQKLSGKPETMERFYYGEFAAQSIRDSADRDITGATQFAYVLKEPVSDPGRLGETVALNRGMRVKVFDNPSEALHWLGITATTNVSDSVSNS